jgi:hypothetical protein
MPNTAALNVLKSIPSGWKGSNPLVRLCAASVTEIRP